MWESAYRDLKDLASSITKKELKLARRVRNLLVVILLLFIVIPIGINFISMIELQQFGSLLSIVSEINTDNSSEMIQIEYGRLESYLSNIVLPATYFKHLMIDLFFNALSQAVLIQNIDIDSVITFIGFGFKLDLFSSIFLWTAITTCLISIISSVTVDTAKLKVLVVGIVISIIYSLAIASVLSILWFFIIVDFELTKGIAISISILLTIFFLYKISKSGKKQ